MKLSAKISMTSLIGTSNQRPVSWGNYFWLIGGYRVVNFWAENLEHLAFDEVECEIFEYKGSKFAVIIDTRIPLEYYYPSLCFTGSSGVSDDIIKSMIEVMPVKDESKLLRYTNYEQYCKDNDIEVITKNGFSIEIHKRFMSSKIWDRISEEPCSMYTPNQFNRKFKDYR